MTACAKDFVTAAKMLRESRLDTKTFQKGVSSFDELWKHLQGKGTLDGEDCVALLTWCENIRSGRLSRLYQVTERDEEVDLSRSVDMLVKSARAIGMEDAEQVNELKNTWRYLMRRYAVIQAWARYRELWGKDRFLMNVYRLPSFLMPRLIMSIAVGILVIVSSAELANIVVGLAGNGRQRAWMLVATAVISWVLSWAEVQRRVRYRSGAWFVRTLGLWVWGVGIAVLVASGVVYTVWQYIPMEPMDRWGIGMLAGASLLIGHTVQLFWEDTPIGEPL